MIDIDSQKFTNPQSIWQVYYNCVLSPINWPRNHDQSDQQLFGLISPEEHELDDFSSESFKNLPNIPFGVNEIMKHVKQVVTKYMHSK